MQFIKCSCMFLAVLGGLNGGSAVSQTPRSASKLTVVDRPDDAGDGLNISWKPSPDASDDGGKQKVVRYEILRRLEDEEVFQIIGETTYHKNSFVDAKCDPKKKYFYQILAVAADGTKSTPLTSTEAIGPTLQFFNTRRTWFGIILLIVGGSVVWFIEMARSGRELKLRKIAGLEAFNEAVGRATETGRTCLFIPGILDINDIQTIAGITVLSRVAQLTAEYGANLEVPTARSLVMTTARETVEAAYLGAGRPDAYNEDDIYYLTDEQFGYVAGVTGMMIRKKPAACFYMGAFYAESLLLAETGNEIGAIQVAGTAMPSQLPFFVAACDYTLIGEEFLAASAYLSGEPHQLGSLKGQDVGKAIGVIMLIFGCVLTTIHAVTGNETVARIASFVKNHILGDAGFLP